MEVIKTTAHLIYIGMLLSIILQVYLNRKLVKAQNDHMNSSPNGFCEEISVDFCMNYIGYNNTYFPNIRGHNNQQEAAMELDGQFPVLLHRIQCSPYSRQLLCSIFIPMCRESERGPSMLLPCQSLCQSVSNSCDPLFRRFGINDALSQVVNCTTLPKDGQEICITYTDDLQLLAVEPYTITDNQGTNTTRGSIEDEAVNTSSTTAVPEVRNLNGNPDIPDGCWALDVSQCNGVPYSYTKMPNYVGHTDYEHALNDFLFQYTDLLNIPCSSLIQEFVCGVYFPPCTLNYGTVPPCRYVCEDVRRECEPLLRLAGYSWPQEVTCDNFPIQAPCLNATGIVYPSQKTGSMNLTEAIPTTTARPLVIEADLLQCYYGGSRYQEGATFPAGDGCNTCSCQYGASVVCTERNCGPPEEQYKCRHDTRLLLAGETFTFALELGCYNCICQEDSTVYCLPTNCTCDYKNNTYQIGDSIQADDMCSSCVCTNDGQWNCTSNDCAKETDTTGTPNETDNSTTTTIRTLVIDLPQCYHNGNAYDEGTTFPEGDGCNTCRCNRGGYLTCSEYDCHPPDQQYQCIYGSRRLLAGETFQFNLETDCYNCTCDLDSSVTCDPVPCLCRSKNCSTQEATTAMPVIPANATQNSTNATIRSLDIDLPQCYHRGITYNEGKSFPEGDGCNTCTCQRGGYITCSEIACSPSGPEYRCQYGTKLLLAGESYTVESEIGCFNCNCQEDGTVSCDKIQCLKDMEDTTTAMKETNETQTTTVETLVIDLQQCFYRGVFHEEGSTFSEGDGCNTCNCKSGGYVTCTEKRCTPTGETYSCQDGTRLLMAGETFALKTSFSCNNCTCYENGTISCKATPCSATCTRDNKHYQAGDVVQGTGICNTCVCMDSGSWSCTTDDCNNLQSTEPSNTKDVDGNNSSTADRSNYDLLCMVMVMLHSLLILRER